MDVNYLHWWVMLQKLPVGSFEWVEVTSQFNLNVIKSYNEESDGQFFLKVNIQYPEELREPHNDLPFLPEKMKT